MSFSANYKRQVEKEKKATKTKHTKKKQVTQKSMSDVPQTAPTGGEATAAQPQQNPTAAKRKKHAEDFIFGDTLGHGSFGDVVKGIDKETGKEYAIKIMDKMLMVRQGKKKYVITERDILSKCNHPNIVKLSYTFQSETSLRKYQQQKGERKP